MSDWNKKACWDDPQWIRERAEEICSQLAKRGDRRFSGQGVYPPWVHDESTDRTIAYSYYGQWVGWQIGGSLVAVDFNNLNSFLQGDLLENQP